MIPVFIGISAGYLLLTVPLGHHARPHRAAAGGGGTMSERSVLYDEPGPRTRRITLIASIVAAILVIVGIYFFVYVPLEAHDQFTAKKWDPLINPSDKNFPLVWKRIGEGLQATVTAAVLAIIASLLVRCGAGGGPAAASVGATAPLRQPEPRGRAAAAGRHGGAQRHYPSLRGVLPRPTRGHHDLFCGPCASRAARRRLRHTLVSRDRTRAVQLRRDRGDPPVGHVRPAGRAT